MKISELLKNKKFTVSFEIFPPKNEGSLENIHNCIEELVELNPDFISVTYGAGGSTTKNTVEVANILKNKFNTNTVAHLTCIDSNKEKISRILDELKEVNVENILALRGDLPQNSSDASEKEFKFAKDLISFLNSNHSFSIGAACYPEGHTENPNKNNDIKNLKEKVNSGVDFLITQMFFDNNHLYNLIDKLDLIDINVPVIAGIMPITNKKQLIKISSLSGAEIPERLKRILDKFENNEDIIQEAGIIYATEQILDLIASNKVNGVHIYTMNKPYIAKRIMDNIKPLLS